MRVAVEGLAKEPNQKGTQNPTHFWHVLKGFVDPDILHTDIFLH